MDRASAPPTPVNGIYPCLPPLTPCHSTTTLQPPATPIPGVPKKKSESEKISENRGYKHAMSKTFPNPIPKYLNTKHTLHLRQKAVVHYSILDVHDAILVPYLVQQWTM